jgi:GT2 family glycosyltransferase
MMPGSILPACRRRVGEASVQAARRGRHRVSRLTSSAVPAEPEAAARPSLSVVVVTHDSAAALGRTLPAIAAELRPGDELIVADNASSDGTLAVVAELMPDAIVVETGSNAGFGVAGNRGAERASGDLLLLLNPDNAVAPGFRDAIELPLIDERGWDAWQGLVTDEDGARLNTRGGVVHFTGIAWAGGAGEPRSEAPSGPEEVAFPSGACLAIPLTRWFELGGFSEPYFLYHEDTDLGLRIRLGGGTVGIEPRAVSDHDYDFDKGPAKWRHLERNRWATLIRDFPTGLLLLLAPALLATELAVFVAAAVSGWLPEKLKATADTLRALPRLRRERREIQATATVGSAVFAEALTPDLASAYLGRVAESQVVRILLRSYWSVVLMACRPRRGE